VTPTALTLSLRSLALLVALTVGAGCISSDRRHAEDTAGDIDADGSEDVEFGCTDALGCDDGDPCTLDSCGDDGRCRHELVAGCEPCNAPSDCEGLGDSCETARCDSGFCTYEVADGCRACEDEAICADGDACTIESCNGTCHYAELGCDDEDPCTVDACDSLAGCTHDDTCEPPVITLSDDPTLTEGDTLVRVGSFTGPASETFTATVDWGEGGDPEALPLEADGTFALAHVYSAEGDFTLTVRVVDGHERASTAELSVTVENAAPTVVLEPFSAIEEGGVLSLFGGVSDPGEDVTGVSVDWGDGGEPEAVTQEPDGTFALSHRYDDDGTYHLTVTATDDVEHGGAEAEVIVANAPPHFVPPSNRVVLEGTPTLMTLPIADPGAADAFSGEVRYGLGGGAEPLVIADHAIILTLTYPDDGTWPVTITLRDGDGGESVDGFSIAVTNVAPAVLDPGDQTLVEGQPLDLRASFTDPGQDSWTAQASFGDGTPVGTPDVDGAAREVALDHAWADDGTYLAFVSVTDDDGGEDAATFMVSVSNAAPAPNAGDDVTLDEGATFTRDAVASDPGLGDVLSGSVRWDDDATDETLSIDVATRAYRLERSFADEGVHEVAVTVRDDDGASATEHFTLTVVNVPPTIDCGSHAVLAAGGRIERTCTFSDPGADSWSGTIDWDDGGEPEPLVLTDGTFEIGHTFANEATYTVLVALDDGTEVGTTQFDVAVGNAPPLVDAGPDLTIDEGGSFVRTGQVYDSSAGAFAATVDYGEGAGPAPLTLTPGLAFDLDHRYVEDGVYDVVVEVVDPDDDSGQDTVHVTVRNLPPGILAGGDADLAEGERLTRSVSIVDPGETDTVTAVVDYGEGDGDEALVIGGDGHADLDHTFSQDGDHTVTVTATDDDGGVGTASFVVHVANGAPVVTVGGDGDAVEGEPFQRVVAFTDAGDDAWTLRVDWGDGSPLAEVFDVHPDQNIPLSHVFADDGDYTVSVTVHDGSVGATETFVVAVANAAPVVALGEDADIDEGSVFTRSGSVSDPGIHDVLTATVDWGDGQGPKPLVLNGGGFTLSRLFPKDGDYTITVTASDGVDEGATTMVLSVGNVAPTVSPGAPLTISEGKALSRTATFTDPGADSWTATVDWDDGGGPEPAAVGPGKTVALSHTYPDDGEHDVAVSVDDGVDGGTGHLSVTVTNVAPTVDAGGDVGLSEGGELTRAGTVSDPGTSDTFTATVDYGEGGVKPLTIKPDRTFALAHTYASHGQYTVTVEVTDDDEGVGTDTFLVTVSNTAPVVTAGPDAQLDEGGVLTRSVAFTDSGADTWTATVDYGDGGGPQPATLNPGTQRVALSHTYMDDGTYEVIVTVSDGVEIGQGSFKAIVANVLPDVDAGGAGSADEGATWSRNGSFGDPGVLDPHSASVDWGDGSAPSPLSLTPEGLFVLRHAFADDGEYTVTVTVHDDDGVGTATVPVSVSNVAPGLPATLGTITLDVGERWTRTVTFTDPGADTWLLTASYGDGPALVTALPSRSFEISHTYWAPGEIAASFAVSDDDGGSDVVSAVVRVENVAPTVEATDPPPVTEGSQVMVTATFDDPGGEAHTATIAWTNGVAQPASVDEEGQVVSGSHAYPDEGQHDVVVAVKDAYGATGTDTAHIVVINVAPVVDAGGDGTTNAFGVLARTASFTDPGADDWTVTVDWGDGSEPDHPTVLSDKRFALVHTYAVADEYTVVVQVDDGDGGVGTATFDVTATVSDCTGVMTTGAQWVGGASGGPTAWNLPANWKPAAVPGAGDDVYLCAGHVYYPVLGQEQTFVDDVHMAPTASISTAGKALTVGGDLIGGAVTGSGTVYMTGGDVELATSVPGLHVVGDVEATAAVAVSGNMSIADGASFRLGSVAVTVRGSLAIWSSASGTGLVLDEEGDHLTVQGKLTAAPGNAATQWPMSTLTDGRLEVQGDLTVTGESGGPIAFLATGTEVLLTGAGKQRVSFDDPGPTRARFADLTLSSDNEVTFGSNVAVMGRLSLPGGVKLSSGRKVMLASSLPVLGPDANYDVTTTAVVGDVTMEDDFYLAGDKHSLSIEQGGALDVGPYTLDIGGALDVYLVGGNDAGLHMSADTSEVSVGDTASWHGVWSQSGGTPLEGGTLWLEGGLLVTGAGQSAFAPNGMTVHIVGGDASRPHDVRFDDITSNHFDGLVLHPGVRMNLLSDVLVNGTLSADNTVRASVTGAHELTAATVNVGGVDFVGARLRTFNIERLADVTFREQDPGAAALTVQLTYIDATVERLRFESVPSAGGAYIYGINGGSAGQKPRLTVLESMPLNGRPWCATTNSFEIHWGAPDDDSDADGLTDLGEHGAGTDPLDEDSDDDTFLDGTEVGVGTAPTNGSSVPFQLYAPEEYAVGDGPYAMAIGDVDGDGNVDIAVSDEEAGTVTVLFAEPAAPGAFTQSVEVPLAEGSAPRGLTVVTLYGQRYVLVASSGTDELTFVGARVMGQGPRDLGPLSALATCAVPSDVAVVPADGIYSGAIVVACSGSDEVRVFTAGYDTSDHSWGWDDGVDYPTGVGPHTLAVGDVTSAVTADVATANEASVTVLRGTTYGALAPLDAAGPSGIALVDMDGAAKDDLVIAHGALDLVSVYPNTGLDAGFDSPQSHDVGATPRSISAGDLDGNGWADLATAAEGDGVVSLLLHGATEDGKHALYPHDVPTVTGAGPYQVLLRDVDGDGNTDIVVLARQLDSVVVIRQAATISTSD